MSAECLRRSGELTPGDLKSVSFTAFDAPSPRAKQVTKKIQRKHGGCWLHFPEAPQLGVSSLKLPDQCAPASCCANAAGPRSPRTPREGSRRDMRDNDGPLRGADPADALREFDVFDNPSTTMSQDQGIKLGDAPAPAADSPDEIFVDET